LPSSGNSAKYMRSSNRDGAPFTFGAQRGAAVITSVAASHTYNTRSRGFVDPRKRELADVPAGRTAVATGVERSAISAPSVGNYFTHTKSHTVAVNQTAVVDTEGSAAGRRHDLVIDQEVAIRRPSRAFIVELGDNRANQMQSQHSESEDDDRLSSSGGSVTSNTSEGRQRLT
jgi:hypothetical protein